MSGGSLVWIDRLSSPINQEHFARCAATLDHRGVDGFRETRLGHIALAQHNFIVPHAAPCPFGEDGLQLVMDGALDHRERLASELGCSAAVCSDPELVLAAYRRWGPSWIEHVHGSVAAVIVDPPLRRVVASRDELGRATLFYHISPRLILLASEPVALLRHPDVRADTDAEWLSWYFSCLQSEVGERTAFTQVKQLLPGQSLLWEPDRVTMIAAERRIGTGRFRCASAAEYAQRFRELLETSIDNLTAGHDRVGIMLSGGMDSCPVACLAAERFRRSGQHLTAYSWTLAGFPESDEGRESSLCAAYADIERYAFPADELWTVPDPPDWPMDVNTPLANSYLKLFIEIYERARSDGCRLLLSGTFGDTLYPDAWDLADALTEREWGIAIRELARLTRRHGFLGLARLPQVRFALKRLLGVGSVRGPRPPAWLTPRAADALSFDMWPPQADLHPRPSQFRRLLGSSVFDEQVGFRYEPTRRGLDVRDPYHDWDLVDFMLSVPAYHCHRGAQLKYLAREAMRGRMPEELRTRPRGSLLGGFFNAGFERSREPIRRFLCRPECSWPEYVKSDYIMRAVTADSASDTDRFLAWWVLAYELWMQRLSVEGCR